MRIAFLSFVCFSVTEKGEEEKRKKNVSQKHR